MRIRTSAMTRSEYITHHDHFRVHLPSPYPPLYNTAVYIYRNRIPRLRYWPPRGGKRRAKRKSSVITEKITLKFSRGKFYVFPDSLLDIFRLDRTRNTNSKKKKKKIIFIIKTYVFQILYNTSNTIYTIPPRLNKTRWCTSKFTDNRNQRRIGVTAYKELNYCTALKIYRIEKFARV